MCDTEWQYQSHFMNGVLCQANEGGMSPSDAVDSVFTARSTKIGVQAQEFTIVNDSAHDYAAWDMIGGWNSNLNADIAIHQGSTTGQQHGDNVLTCSPIFGPVSPLPPRRMSGNDWSEEVGQVSFVCEEHVGSCP
jgi:hypothetical protein